MWRFQLYATSGHSYNFVSSKGSIEGALIEFLRFSCFDEQSTLIVSDIMQKRKILRTRNAFDVLQWSMQFKCK